MTYQVKGKQRQAILERDNSTCQYCGKPASSIDHVVPYSEIRDSSPENLVVCCASCNRYGGNRVFDTFEEKKAYILGRRNAWRGRKHTIDPDTVNAIFSEEERRREPSPYDVKYKRHTYRIKPEVHGALKSIAKQHGVGINDLVRWIFQDFIERHEKEEVELPVQKFVVVRLRLSD